MDDPNSKGYAFPDPPAPYELECFRVYVPKHSLYIGAFWQAYQFFTTWIAWWRDPFKRGKQAAALWRTAYDKARALYELTKGTCEMNVTCIRQHPNDKCILQVEFDGNNVWVDVANFKDCNGCGGGGAMQFDGVNVSIYNDCSGEFEPSGEPFNPVTSQLFDSLYGQDESGRCNGAANIAVWMHDTATAGLQWYNTVDSVAAAAITIIGLIISNVGGKFIYDLLLAALTAEFLTQADWWGDAAAEDITDEVKLLLYPFMDEDGTIREPNYAAAVEAMLAMRDSQTPDTALRARWGFEATFLQVFGASIISRQNKYAGITDADCAGGGFNHIFDFTTGKQGWVEDEMTGAVYVTGQGWKQIDWIDAFGNYYTIANIKRALPSRTITSLKVYYTATLGVSNPEDAVERRKAGAYYNSHSTVLGTDELTEEGSHVWTFTGSQAGCILLMPSIVVGHWSEEPEEPAGGTVTITKVIVSGDGEDPF